MQPEKRDSVDVKLLLDGKYLRTGATLQEEVKGRWKGEGGTKTPYALSFPLPPLTSAGWPSTYVFVTVNQALRYLATSSSVH